MTKENGLSTPKLTKTSRSYSEKIKLKVVQEITTGLLTHRAAAKKYIINRKTVSNWVTTQSHNNLRPMEIAKTAMIDIKEDSKVRVLAKQAISLTESSVEVRISPQDR